MGVGTGEVVLMIREGETPKVSCRFPSRKEVRQAAPSDTATLSIFLIPEIEDLNRQTNSQYNNAPELSASFPLLGVAFLLAI